MNMSFTLILLSVTFCFIVAECLAAGHPKLQKHIYYVAFTWAVIWCTAKYAYGADIYSYIPFYNKLIHPSIDLSNPDLYFEKGFVGFCSILKYWGFSFWGMTAVISLLYFTAIGLLWRKIKTYKTLGLWVLLCLDYLFYLTQFRQCVATSFLILAILAFEKKWYLPSILLAFLAISMHKSAIIIVGCIMLFYLFRKIPITAREYLLLAIALVLLMFIPLQPIMLQVLSKLPLGSSITGSIEHHLLLGKTFQKIFILYIGTILCLAYYTRNTAHNKTLHWLMWCCVAVIVCLYPYYFLLNRLRSYFLPFLIVYIINMLTQEHITDKLPRQIYTVVVIGYLLLVTIQIPAGNKKLKASIDNVSLVFERRKHTEQELMNRQLKQAEIYWKHDNDKALNLGISK